MKKILASFLLPVIFMLFSGLEFRQQDKPEFIYVYDPLCGWCYGFSPVIQEIKKKYEGQASFSIYSGGLATGENVIPIGELFQKIKGSLENLEDMTGVRFGEPYMKMIDEGVYIYNSEPPSVALVVVKDMKPEVAFDYAAELHTIFFSEGKSLNDTATYGELAESFGMDRTVFLKKFTDTTYKNKAKAEFRLVEENGIAGFPFLFLKKGDEVHIIADGYIPFKKADKTIQKILN